MLRNGRTALATAYCAPQQPSEDWKCGAETDCSNKAAPEQAVLVGGVSGRPGRPAAAASGGQVKVHTARFLVRICRAANR